MVTSKVNNDGSVTTSTEDETSDPTGLVAYPDEPVTTTFDGEPATAESKVVEPVTTESKTVKRAAKKKG